MINGISIIITAYKTPQFINSCLRSIYNQDWLKKNDNWEIIIGVDGCKDTLNTIVKGKNTRILFFPENHGTYIVRNTLIKESKYNGIISFDSDDLMLPDFVSNTVEKSKEYDYIRYRYGDGRKVTFGTMFIKKKLFDIFGGYQPWVCSADRDLKMRVESYGIKNTELKDKNYIQRREHFNQLTKAPKTGLKTEIRYKLHNTTNENVAKKEYHVKPVTAEFVEIEDNSLKTRIKNTKEKYKNIKTNEICGCAAWKFTCVERQLSKNIVEEYYKQTGIQLYYGTFDGSVFNRAAARNVAIKKALNENPQCKVLWIFDTDVVVDVEQMWEACSLAEKTGKIIIAFDQIWFANNDKKSKNIHEMYANGKLYKDMVSCAIAVPVDLWKESGGYDERFTSWGGEDRAFWFVCNSLKGSDRINGNAYHYWHPEERNSSSKLYNESQSLAMEYKKAANYLKATGYLPQIGDGSIGKPNIDKIKELISEAQKIKGQGRICTPEECKFMEPVKWIKPKTGKIIFAMQGTDLYSRLCKSDKWEKSKC